MKGSEAGWRRLRVVRALDLLLSREMQVLTNAIAFNVLMCLFPLLVVIVSASQALPVGRRAVPALALVLDELIPFGRTALADSMRTLTRTAKGLEVFSLVVIVWGSSGIFIPVELALNRAWGGKPSRHIVLSRALAFLMTVLVGVLALGSVLLSVWARSWGRDSLLGAYGAKASALLLSYLLFFAIYRLVPGTAVGSAVAARASAWSAGLWELAKYLFVARVGAMHLEAFYGPLAFAVSLVLWAYVSSMVLVLGALMAPAGKSR